jgi:arginyl-tRNA synthetase
VVGAEQRLHLSMVFAAARLAGWLSDDRHANHAVVGAVRGADGRRLRTRSGESIRLIDLLDEAIARVARGLEDRDDLPADERQTVARQVGIGAIKYADLSVDRERDYLFNWDTMFALEGNTGPYLQYAVARIQSVINRSGRTAADAAAGDIRISHDTERALVLHALRFGQEAHGVSETLQPHRLCGYLYDLATRFTAFYESVPILRAENESLTSSRLALSVLVARTLTKGLELLGIEAPRRM